MLSGLLDHFRIEGPLGTGGMGEAYRNLLTRPSRPCVPLVRLDPAWDPLRKHPRFQKFLEKHGARP